LLAAGMVWYGSWKWSRKGANLKGLTF